MPTQIVETSELRGFLVGLAVTGKPAPLDVETSLEELGLLADTAGIHVVGQTYQRVAHPHPATLIGKGKVEEVKQWIDDLKVNIVIFDNELSPRHQRELERIFGDDVQVLDRTALILDVFAQHARTREGALQVMLAQYQYRLPRLTRQWTHLIRQAGGTSARGGAGGVGLRGPGETQLETDRRDIRRRIAKLQRELEQVRIHRAEYRQQRRKQGLPVVALVGYTNAGKSTLLNALSGASVLVADQLFATLDPTTRRVQLPGGQQMLLTDTVGFIQKLPHHLVAAFRATLEEINDASLLLHVVDASHPNASQQLQVVENVLNLDLNVIGIPIIRVLNKADLILDGIEKDRLGELQTQYADTILISAVKQTGLEALAEEIQRQLLSIGPGQPPG